MKERPILFSSEMLRSILDGRKTQTRRVVKSDRQVIVNDYGNAFVVDGVYRDGSLKYRHLACPYGQPGDRLWVRETHRFIQIVGSRPPAITVEYLVDGERRDIVGGKLPKRLHSDIRPSIHMPRWASRLLLEIVSVRVERLQKISEEDARAEGIEPLEYVYATGDAPWGGEIDDVRESYRAAFLERDFAKKHNNAWVWVIEFKRGEHAVFE